MNRRVRTIWLLLLALALLLAGCDVNVNLGSGEATETPTATGEAPSAPTETAAAPPDDASATPVPPTSTPLPPTPTPTSEPEPQPERIRFAPGEISATVTGRVPANGAQTYVLRALEGQTMEVELVSAAVDLRLEIWGQDGTPLKRAAVGGPSWTGTLPSTQDYFVKAVSFGSAAEYRLTVTVLPLESERPATRIAFDPGAISATRTGRVAADGAALYVLRAMGGQTMEVALDVAAADVVLEIWGEDGQPLLRHVTGQTFWAGVLPATQDYFIHVVSFGSAADYALTVTIPPLEGEPEPQRISFEAGEISATVTGYVPASGADVYVLRALAGQTMTVELDVAARDVVLEIWGEDGQPLLRHVTGQTSWSETLHASQDYFIQVVSFGSAANYSLTVTIPPP